MRGIRLGWGSTLPLAVGIALGIGALAVIRYVTEPLGLLIVAIAIAEALEPLVTWLQRRMRRSFAITLVILAVVLVFSLAGWLVIPSLAAQVTSLVERGPGMVKDVQGWLHRADSVTQGSISKIITGAAGGVLQYVVTLPRQLLSALTDLLVIVFLAIYWLAGSPGLSRFVQSLFPAAKRDRSTKLLHDMGQAMGGYVRGAAINGAVMAVLAGVGLWIIGVDYPIALGVITGMGEPIPYIGPVAAGIPVILVALAQSPTKALIALGLYCFLQEFEGHVLTPNIMERQTSIPQTLVIVAIVIGAGLGGVLGIIVAIPTAAAVHVLALEVAAPAFRRATGAV
ncbi:MAG TPA: AI-2E family transporter [Gemmatimonadaceae bacterium]|nr:AI-2E family transporter [Gemmatimonadaceae bacterium]